MKGRAREELRDDRSAAIDVAADEVRIKSFHLRGRERTACENARAKAWCETFNLILDAIGHIDRRTVWDVTIGPQRVLTFRRARRVEQRRLREQHERTIRTLPLPDRRLGFFDLRQRTTEMNRRCLLTLCRAPRHWTIKRRV